MNKIRKLAFQSFKKWCNSNDWEIIGYSDCKFCDDAETSSQIKNEDDEYSCCKYCIAPKVLCGGGEKGLFHATYQLYTTTDSYKPIKSIRLMRIGIIFLMLFKRLPAWFVKILRKHITKLNIKYNRIDF